MSVGRAESRTQAESRAPMGVWRQEGPDEFGGRL